MNTREIVWSLDDMELAAAFAGIAASSLASQLLTPWEISTAPAMADYVVKHGALSWRQRRIARQCVENAFGQLTRAREMQKLTANVARSPG